MAGVRSEGAGEHGRKGKAGRYPPREDLLAALRAARDEMRGLKGNIEDLGRSDYRTNGKSGADQGGAIAEDVVGTSTSSEPGEMCDSHHSLIVNPRFKTGRSGRHFLNRMSGCM